MMRAWFIIIIFAITLSFVVALPTITVKIQEKGVYTQDRVVYTFAATETDGISATRYVFPVYIPNTYPAYTFFIQHSIFVAQDSLCQTILPYWIQSKGTDGAIIWIYVATMQSSGSTTFYVCASTTNPSPASGNPEVNGMFMLFDGFDGSGTILWSNGSVGIEAYTETPITTVSNGTLTMIFSGGTDTQAALAAGNIDALDTPYFIVMARMSFAGDSLGAIGGAYINISNWLATAYIGNAYIAHSPISSENGMYMFFSSSDWFTASSAYPQYYSATLTSTWIINAMWAFFDAYPVVYPAVYNDEMSLITYTYASLEFSDISPEIGLFQLRWGDGYSAPESFTMYVDWFAVIQYWGWPSINYIGATVHEVYVT